MCPVQRREVGKLSQSQHAASVAGLTSALFWSLTYLLIFRHVQEWRHQLFFFLQRPLVAYSVKNVQVYATNNTVFRETTTERWVVEQSASLALGLVLFSNRNHSLNKPQSVAQTEAGMQFYISAGWSANATDYLSQKLDFCRSTKRMLLEWYLASHRGRTETLLEPVN